MWFDPELFMHIMDTPVRQAKVWNARLNRLIADAEYLRADPDDDGANPLMSAIRRGVGSQQRQVDEADLMEAIGDR